MQDFSKGRRGANARRLLKSLGWMLVLLIVTVVAVRGAWGMYGKFTEAAASDEVSQKELAGVQAQQAQVTASVDSFTSSRGLEEEVRERYGMVKPGEGQIQIVRDTSSSTAQKAPAANIFMQAWQALFGWI